jgi:hypothetical protein
MNKQIAKLDDKIENEFKENFLAKNKDTEERDEVEVKINLLILMNLLVIYNFHADKEN